MPRRQQFYDPIIQAPEEQLEGTSEDELAGQMQVTGVLVPVPLQFEPGFYFHATEVGAALRRMARSETGEAAHVLILAAESFEQAVIPEEQQRSLYTELAEPAAAVPDEVATTEPLVTVLVPEHPAGPDAHPNVARVEMFPDENGKWSIRAVDEQGAIVEAPPGQSTDVGFMEEEARRRWPGKSIHVLPNEMADSTWDEQDHATTWNGRPRPSDKRLFGG